MQGLAKPNEEATEVGITTDVRPAQPHITENDNCSDSVSGSDRIIAYIAGDLSDDERFRFAAHVAECEYCLHEVVLWRMAEVLAKAQDDREAASEPTLFTFTQETNLI